MSLDVKQSPAEKPIVGEAPPALPWITWFSQARDILSALTLSGPSSDRPTKLLWVGRPFWDETLQTPVYLASVEPNVWKQVAVTADLVTPTGTVSPQAEASGLVVNISTATDISVTADEILLKAAEGGAIKLTSVSLNAMMPAGLDIGFETANTWYYIWLVTDGTTPRLLISLSRTAPAMPPGYTHKGLLSAVRNNASSDFVQARTQGAGTDIVGVQVLNAGTAAVATAVSVGPAAPPIARAVSGFFQVNATVAGAREAILSADGTRGVQIAQDDAVETATVGCNFRVRFNNDTSQIFYRVVPPNNRAFITVTGWEF